MVIVAKYCSYCSACGRPIAAGTKVQYDPSGKKGKRVRCLSCPETPKAAAPATPAPSPESLERDCWLVMLDWEVERWTKDMVAEYLDCMGVDDDSLAKAFTSRFPGPEFWTNPTETVINLPPKEAKDIVDLAAMLRYTTPG